MLYIHIYGIYAIHICLYKYAMYAIYKHAMHDIIMLCVRYIIYNYAMYAIYYIGIINITYPCYICVYNTIKLYLYI